MKTKKLIVTLIITTLTILNCYSVFAADNSVANNSTATNTSTVATEPSISAGAAFLMDNRTNKVLYKKNENKKMYPASTTKILTAIIILENCNLDDTLTASYDAITSVPDGYTIANIQIDEQLTVEQLLELLLVHSANDAANILAEHAGGSIDSFVSMMNTKVNELGLTGSHFTNVYGLHDDNHYTTAHDLAFLMKYCLKNDTFRKISGQASCAIPATNKSGTRTYKSTNELIIPKTKSYYPYLTAGKTGFTTPAKECLVSASYKDNLELIGVILGSNSRFSDARSLYNYAYDNYSLKPIANEKDVVSNVKISNATKETKDLDLLLNETISALVSNSDSISEISPEITLNKNISAPIEEGAALGKAKYTVNGVQYTTDVIASHSVEESKVLIYCLYGGAFLIFILLVYEIFFNKKRKSKKIKRIKYYY